LPFSESLAAQKSSTSIFWSSAFASLVSPQLLVFSANEPFFFYSQQPSRTNKQADTTKSKHQTKEKLEKAH
jgi:hypothetical protein